MFGRTSVLVYVFQQGGRKLKGKYRTDLSATPTLLQHQQLLILHDSLQSELALHIIYICSKKLKSLAISEDNFTNRTGKSFSKLFNQQNGPYTNKRNTSNENVAKDNGRKEATISLTMFFRYFHQTILRQNVSISIVLEMRSFNFTVNNNPYLKYQPGENVCKTVNFNPITQLARQLY
ncbi:hypothetical protein CBL_03690 [Carabus blaptoides fortunei]